MKEARSIALKALGVVLIALAVLQWLTFSYPAINPFWPGAIFATEAISQALNFVVVALIGAAGLFLFKLPEWLDEKDT